MCTRAVHIEVVDSLETSAFLIAFFKFADIRGNPVIMFSDSGRNFVESHEELGQAVHSLNSKLASSSLANRNIHITFHDNTLSTLLVLFVCSMIGL